MQHDKVLLDLLAQALDAELVQGAPFAAQLDHLRVPSSRAVRICEGVGRGVVFRVLQRRGCEVG